MRNDWTSQPTLTERELPQATDFGQFHPFIKGVFSQWHPTPFTLDGLEFNCAEQAMMWSKAQLFNASDLADKILQTDDPAAQKRFGQQVPNFDGEEWHKWRVDIVFRSNLAKFTQNTGAGRQLRNTAPAMLVEANPRDWNWGNGLQIDDPRNSEPEHWKGTNLLGRILTGIRDRQIDT